NTYSKMEQLLADYDRVISMPDRAQLYTPVIRWNGFDNQYHNWLTDFIRGEFGVSYFNGQPVTQKIKTAAEWTFIINIFSIFFTFLLSIPIGVLAAKYQGQFFDRFSSLLFFFLYSVPTFWMATMLVVFFTTSQYGMQWFSSIGLGTVASDASFWERFWERGGHLILPVFCITYGSIAFISRQVRGGMLTVIRQDYVRTARAKGLSENRVIWRHAFRNSLFPLITIFSLVLPATLTGSVIVEVIFNIPGMGRLLLNSIFTSDWPIVITVLMLIAILTMLGNLLADVLFALVDPRVKFHQDVSR
ncbi:MAG: ABC transporter permease, partial [Bacteroidota bacterium]